MIRIQFNDSPKFLDAHFCIEDDIVTLIGEKVVPNTSGFKTYHLNGAFLGDYSDFTEVVEAETKGIVKFGRHA